MTSDTQHSPPSIGERYAAATTSSKLRVGAGRSDADYLIAAGWLADNLGALLLRLASEFDAVKGEHGVAQAEFDRVEMVACRLEVQHKHFIGPRRKAITFADEAAELRRSAIAQMLTTRAMILIHLKSLRATRQALDAVAWLRVQRLGLPWSGEVVAKIVGQVLDVHLDPTCHHCQGRGRNGGYGSVVTTCRYCRSGMRRSGFVGKDIEQHEFGGWLLALLDQAKNYGAAGIKRAMADVVVTRREDADQAEGDLTKRLQGMRSAEASAD